MPFNLELRERGRQPQEHVKGKNSPFLLWNGASPRLTTDNKPVTFWDVGSDVFEIGRNGRARKVNVTNGGMAVPSAVGLGSKFVAVINYEVIAAPSATRVLFAGKTSFSQSNGFMLYGSSANAIGANGGDSSGFPSLTSTGIFAVGASGTIATEFDGTAVRVYKDGRYLGAMTLSSPAGANAAGIGIGAYTASSSEGANGFRIFAAGIVLNGSGRELSANPWQLFEQEEEFSFYAAAGGSSTSLIIQDATHAHTADNLVLTSSTALTIADALHAHAADNIVLTSQTALTIAEAIHAHTVDNLTLTATSGTNLVVADAAHRHSADNLSLTLDAFLAIQDAAHAHSADNIALTQATFLAIADALHGHAADNIDLSNAPALVVQDSTHGHTADNLGLTLDTWLVIADAVHAHTADNVVLTSQLLLAIQDAVHGHTVDNVTFGAGYTTLELIYKILANKQALNPTTGKFTIWDDDGVTILFQSDAWADAAGTVPYAGGNLARIDRLN